MKKLLPIFISVITIIFSVMSVEASENILRSVDVKTTPNAYTIELTSTTPARMTKNIVSANRIIINLKDVKISSNLSTKYDGNAVIDNIIVEPNGRNGANILVQGNNIAYSDVTFKAPSTVEQIEDNISSSVLSLVSLFSDNSTSNKSIQILTFLIFVGILFAEIRFIKSKYDELQNEKMEMLKDIENTKDFKEYTPGYGNAGIKKPYTTPIYGVAHNTSNIRANYLNRLKTSETTTLNMLINSDNKESEIIDRLVNNKPVFGSLSNREVKTDVVTETNESKPISNPLVNDRFNKQLERLEAMTKLYRANSTPQKSEKEFKSRLNELY